MTFEKKIEILEKAIKAQDKLYKAEQMKIDFDNKGIIDLSEREYKEAERLSELFKTRKVAMEAILAWMVDDSIAEEYENFLDRQFA